MTKIKEIHPDGIQSKPVEFRQFGRFYINYNQLNKGILIVRYKSGAGIPTITKQKISNEMVLLLTSLYDNKSIDYDIGSKLSKYEKELFFNLMKRSKLDELYDLDKSKIEISNEDLIKQFKIIQGEIGAGNSNVELLKEATELLEKMSARGIITKEKSIELITEINEFLK